MCNLVKKLRGGGACFFFQEGGGGISKGGHVSSFKRGGPLAWEVHWLGGGGYVDERICCMYLCIRPHTTLARGSTVMQ